MNRSFLGILALVVLGIVLASPAGAQTHERAVIAGTLIEDRDGDGALSPADGGARTLVMLMQRSADGGYKCVSHTQSDAEGKFRFEDLSLADYELYVFWDPGFFDVSASRDMPVAVGTSEALADGLESHVVRLKKLPDGQAPYGPPNPSGGVAVSCEGLDNPSKAQSLCQVTGPDTYAGPSLVDFGVGSLGITLPPGTYRIWFSPPPSQPAMTVCYVEGNSSVTISLGSSLEAGRVVNDPAAMMVLDAIVGSATRIGGDSKRENTPPSIPSIRPPDTGNAGLN